MNEHWMTKKLPREADRMAPSGASEIRLLPSFPEGEIVHATALADQPSQPVMIEGFGEWFYILEGEGELWRADRGARKRYPAHGSALCHDSSGNRLPIPGGRGTDEVPRGDGTAV